MSKKRDATVVRCERDWEHQAQVLARYVEHLQACPGCGFLARSPGYDGNTHNIWSDEYCEECDHEFCNDCLIPQEKMPRLICGQCASKRKKLTKK